MFGKIFSEINIDDIKTLISNGIAESQNIEFKQEVWDRSDEAIREMLRDISAMANAYGGYMVIGIEEESNSGKALRLLKIPNAEDERDRIFASCLANFQPRIIGLDIKTLEYETGKKIILIKIPNSLTLHQITFKGLYQFWKRHDRQKDKMSVDEIKDAILKNNLGSEESKDLLLRRSAEIESLGGRIILLCATPIKLEAELFKIDNGPLRELIRHSNNERFGGWNFNNDYKQTKPSLNGLKIGDNEGNFSLELYRNGYLEGIAKISNDIIDNIVLQSGERPTIRSWAIIDSVYSFTKRLKDILNLIGYDSPYVVQVSILNIKGLHLLPYKEGAGMSRRNSEKWTEQHLKLPAIIYENINPEIITKELTDRIWQAFGFESEPYFLNGSFNFS